MTVLQIILATEFPTKLSTSEALSQIISSNLNTQPHALNVTSNFTFNPSGSSATSTSQTYSNSQYGFSLSLPEEYTVRTDTGHGDYDYSMNKYTISLGSKNGTTNPDGSTSYPYIAIISIEPGSEQLSDYVNQMYQHTPSSSFVGAANAQVAGQPAIRFAETYGGRSTILYYLKYNGNIYTFEQSPSLTNQQFDEMVSTLTFTK